MTQKNSLSQLALNYTQEHQKGKFHDKQNYLYQE